MNNQVQFPCLRCCFPPDFFFLQKTFNNFFWKTIDSVKNLKTKQIAGGREGAGRGGGHVLCVIMTQCVRKSICDSILSQDGFERNFPKTKSYTITSESHFRSSCMQIFFEIGAPRNFAIFTGKHPCWSLFNKVAGLMTWNFI